MAHRVYLIWKDPEIGARADNWQYLSGNEFFEFLHSGNAEGRYFIRMKDTDEPKSGEDIWIEATESVYLKWRQEYDRARYVKKMEGRRPLSLNVPAGEGDQLIDLVPNGRMRPEDRIIFEETVEEMRKLIESCTGLDRAILGNIFCEEPAPLEAIAHAYGVNRSTVLRRQRKLILELGKMME